MALARIAGVSSVNGMTGDVTISTTGTPDIAQILAKDHGTVDPTGATDQAPILRACYATALTALASGAKSTEIVWPAGTFKMSTGDSSSGAALLIKDTVGGHTGQVKLRGQGVAATKFKMVGGYTLIANNPAYLTGTLGNLALEQFTVDHNNSNVTGRPVALLGIFTGNQNIDRVTIHDVNIVNMLAPNFNTVVLGVSIQDYTSVWNDSVASTITNIDIRRCDFRGGSYGIQIQAFNASTQGQRFDQDILAGGYASHTFIDNIVIEDFKWDSEAVNFQSGAANVSDSAGVMLGQNAVMGRIRLTDCAVKGSYDVGYEIDTVYDCVMTRCFAEDSINEGFYHRPSLGGLPDVGGPTGAGPAYGRANFSMVDCSVRINKLASATLGRPVAGGQAVPGGFVFDSFDFGNPSGSVAVRNFNYVADGPRAVYAWGSVNSVSGGFRSVDLDNIRVTQTNLASTDGQAYQTGPLILGLTGRGVVRVRGLYYAVEGTGPTTPGTLTINPLWLASAYDHTVDIDGIHAKVNLTPSSGAISYIEAILGVNDSNTDTFAWNEAFTQGWRSDLTGSGQSTANFTVTGGDTLTVNSPGTTEYRLTQLKNESSGNQHQPATDQVISIQATKPTTPTSSYKHGVRLKCEPKAGANSIHCYVDYTGTNYRIRVDTEVAGVLTNRASTTIGAGVSAPFYVRGSIKDNVVTAEYLTAAPTSTVAPAAAFSSTYTLSNADSTLAPLGPQGVQGYGGLVWRPVDSGSTTKAFRNFQMSVVSGRIARVAPLAITGTGTATVITSWTANVSEQWRARGVLELPEWDMTGYATVGHTINATGDPVFTKNLRANRWTYITPPAAAAITVTGSPFTYTNVDGYDEDVAIYGGTVSVVSVTRRNASASQVADSTGRIVRLAPGESVTVTYSVAPTMRATPVT